MQVSVITDEVSSDPETALELLHEWGVKAVELRYVDDQRFPAVSDYWSARLPRLLDEFGMTVAALSPGLFQFPYPQSSGPLQIFRATDMALVRRERDAQALLDTHVKQLLPSSIEAAKQLGARTIVCFGFDFHRPDPAEPIPEAAIQVLRHAATSVGEAGLILTLEPHNWSSRTADIVRRVNHPAFGINWDPANTFAAGEDVPFPDGYAHVRPFVRHVHFKDVTRDPITGQRIWVLDGVLDWAGIIRALKDDNYTGYISVETHLRPKVQGTLKTLGRLRALIDGTQPERQPDDRGLVSHAV
jgi:sugar phosphate isomerase/epimerase